MNQEAIFETMPFELDPEIQGEIFEGENERNSLRQPPRPRPSSGSRSSFTAGQRPGRSSAFSPARPKKPPVRKPSPSGFRPRGSWGVIHEPYGLVIGPYPSEPEPSFGTERVRWVQDCLNQVMGLQLPITGVMGSETRSAVRSFQKQQGLKANGILESDTEETLKAACGEKPAAVGNDADNLQEMELGPLEATLVWIPNRSPDAPEPKNGYLLSLAQARAVKGGGVYIIIGDSTFPAGGANKIVKVGKTESFASRFSNYRLTHNAANWKNLRVYLGHIKGFLPADAQIERALTRLLYRAGQELRGARPIIAAPLRGQLRVENILPPPLLAGGNYLRTAYNAAPPARDPGNKLIPKASGVIPPDNPGTRNTLILNRQNFPEWEFSNAREIYGEITLESPFSEAEEIELAAELLSISSEEELDQFLGNLIKGAWKGIKKAGGFVGKIAKPLGSVLKGVAKAALPFVGGALGSFIPIPGVGTALGSALGGALSKALELESGEFEQEEQELEIARRFVRIAGTAARQTALTDPHANPQTAAKAAVMSAARQHLPSLPASVTSTDLTRGVATGCASTGRWVRQGRGIMIMGA